MMKGGKEWISWPPCGVPGQAHHFSVRQLGCLLMKSAFEGKWDE
jgi:hypothetical protein